MAQGKTAKIGRWSIFLITLISFLGFGLYTIKKNQGGRELQTVTGYKAFDDASVKEAEKMMIQSGGRVKPLVTWAKFLIYSLNGSSSIKFEQGGEKYKLSATEITLQCLFRPEFARKLELFRVEDKVILSSLNIESDVLSGKEKRDKYSFNELKPFFSPLII